MSEQKNSKQIPENVVKILERQFKQPVKTVDFKEEYKKHQGKNQYDICVFIVNGTYSVSLYNNCTSLYSYQTTASYEEKSKNFGKRVRRLMDESGVSWELGKLIVTNICDDEDISKVGVNLKKAREYAKSEQWKDMHIDLNDRRNVVFLLHVHDLNLRVFDLANKRTLYLLKEYLFA